MRQAMAEVRGMVGAVGVAGALAGAGLVGAASAQGVPDYDFDWITIGDVGNRDTRPEEMPWEPDFAIGGVDYEYRITKHEVTVEQWFEFVVAYAPFFDRENNNIGSSDFTSFWIRYDRSDDEFRMTPGAERYAADMAWDYAARYVNWLHNGKVQEQWVFEDGVYDTSTFGWDEDNREWTHQREHHPDARFWIPTLDEWTKAAYWDPQKDDGEGGYWRFPHGSEEVPIVDFPDEGGETNAGLDHPDGWPAYLDVGSYEDALSPWGLLDATGGVSEWTEYAGIHGHRYTKGSDVWRGRPQFWDPIDDLSSRIPIFGGPGLRVVSIPGPSPIVGVGMMLFTCTRIRRRML